MAKQRSHAVLQLHAFRASTSHSVAEWRVGYCFQHLFSHLTSEFRYVCVPDCFDVHWNWLVFTMTAC